MTGGRFQWSIAFSVKMEAVPFLEACLEPVCLAVTAFGDSDTDDDWRVEGIAADEPDRAQLKAALNAAFPDGDAPTPVIDLIPPKDWLTAATLKTHRRWAWYRSCWTRVRPSDRESTARPRVA